MIPPRRVLRPQPAFAPFPRGRFRHVRPRVRRSQGGRGERRESRGGYECWGRHFLQAHRHGHGLRQRPHLRLPLDSAITIAFRAIGRISTRRALGYVVSQLGGAALAGLAIVAIVDHAGDAGATALRIGGTSAALVSELILTLFLAFVFLGMATPGGPFAAIAVGGYVGFAVTGWGPVANVSMNPARSFGPALAANVWDAHWVYRLAPIVGALLAAAAYEMLREPHTPGSGEENNG